MSPGIFKANYDVKGDFDNSSDSDNDQNMKNKIDKLNSNIT